MVIKKVSILLPLFIFGISPDGWPDSIKSIHYTANPLTTMKMDENDGPVQKRMESVMKTTKSLEKSKTPSQPDLLHSDDGARMNDIKPDIDFLQALEEKKRSPLKECLDKVVFSYDLVQNLWNHRFSYSIGVAEAKSSNPGVGQSYFGSYPSENQNLEQGKILATFRLRQSKKDELFKEIFMGFRFSFNPLSGHMFLGMNANPSSETGTGIVIPF
jgi:hypothetical protein